MFSVFKIEQWVINASEWPDQVVSESGKAANTTINTWIRSQHSYHVVNCDQENFLKTLSKLNIPALLLTSHEKFDISTSY